MIRNLCYLNLTESNRIAPRRRVLKAGSSVFGGSAIDCTVRNLSETGAALEVVTPLFIPDRFTLIVLTDKWKRPCHIVWRKERRIGVAVKLAPPSIGSHIRSEDLTPRSFITAICRLESDDGVSKPTCTASAFAIASACSMRDIRLDRRADDHS